jgi:archaetidylinositol phosphate synthase
MKSEIKKLTPGNSNIAQSERTTPANESTGFRNATRIQESVTSGVERKALAWLASRMPRWVNSDHLTLLGFAGMLLAGGSYWLSRNHPVGLLLATLCLGINWFGDSLDGTLARVRNKQRPRYGFYVDHMIDAFGTIAIIGGLAASGHIGSHIALGMLVAFLLLSIETYLASYAVGIFRLSAWMFGPTEIRILLAAGNVTLWLSPNITIAGSSWRLFDFGGAVAAFGMILVTIIATCSHTAKLYRQETER